MTRLLSILLLSCLSAFASLPTLGELRVERYTPPAIPLGLSEWDVRRPHTKAVNIVFVSEAYTQDRLMVALMDFQRARDVVFSIQPFARHRDAFNLYRYLVPSAENGATKPGGPTRDTEFGSYYGDRGVRRLIGYDADTYFRLRTALSDRVHRPVYVMVVNDAEYGGSGGNPVTASIHNESGWIALHEILHQLAGLGDEYKVSAGALNFEYPNVTKSTNTAAWIGFPGAGFHQIEAGRWRPFNIACLMQSLGARKLDPWCEQVAEWKILERIQ